MSKTERLPVLYDPELYDFPDSEETGRHSIWVMVGLFVVFGLATFLF